MRSILAIILGAAVLLAAGDARAQDSKLGVYLSMTADDAVGKRLAFYLRDEVRKSGTFRDATRGDNYFTVQFVTLDPYDDGRGTVYSYAINIANKDGLDYFMSAYVGTCPVNQEQHCAQTMFATLGEQLETIIEVFRKTRQQGLKR